MEKDLDKVAENQLVWYEMLEKFYKEFDPIVNKALEEMEKEAPETTGESCPECNSDLVVRYGKFGSFVACSNYPTCKYIKKTEQKPVEICDCPECGGKILERKTKRGKIFYGCSNYPKCTNALWDKPTGELCPDCKKLLVTKKDKIVCPNCNNDK